MKAKLVATIVVMLFLASILSMAFIAPAAGISPLFGLVGEWKLDEGAGKVATDSSGYGNNGFLSGGRFGGALSFDGIDDYVVVGITFD